MGLLSEHSISKSNGVLWSLNEHYIYRILQNMHFADIPFCPVFLDNNLCFLPSPLSPIHSVFSKHIVSPFFVIYNWLIIIIIHWHSASKRSRRLNYKECQMWTVQHAFNCCVCLKMCICAAEIFSLIAPILQCKHATYCHGNMNIWFYTNMPTFQPGCPLL